MHSQKWDENFGVNFIKIVIPIALQYFLNSSLHVIDTIIVGKLGTTEIAAVGIATQICFILSLCIFGINSGSSIFMSQFWGRSDVANIKRTIGVSLLLNISIALPFVFLFQFFPVQIFNLFSHDDKVISLGAEFLKISSINYILIPVIYTYLTVLKSIRDVFFATLISIITSIINTLLNYILVFGKFGIPALGVKGAAIATVISVLIEFCFLISRLFFGNHILSTKFQELTDFSFSFLKIILSKIIPVLCTEVIWVLGISMYTMIFAKISTDYIASYNIVTSIQRLMSMWTFGIANACAILVGNQIGTNDSEGAFKIAKNCIIISLVIAGFFSVLLYYNIDFALSFFNISSDIYHNCKKMLIICSILMFTKFFNFVAYIGIIRGSGDTKFTFIINTIAIWGVAIPASTIGGFFFKLSVEWIYILVLLEEIFNFIFGIYRFLSKKWLQKIDIELNENPISDDPPIVIAG